MADYIDREELLNDLFILNINDATKVFEHIAKLPSIDAVEVVRCKDCWNYRNNNLCGVSGLIVDDDFFCKWGEKE